MTRWRNVPEKAEPVYEEQDGISFYYTEKERGEAGLYFPLAIEDEDFFYAQLLHYFLERQADKSGLSFYTILVPMESVVDPQEINPQFQLVLYGENVAESLKQTVEFLQSEDAWNESVLAEYIKTAPQSILYSYYDPYFVSSELKGSALSAGGSFGYLFPQNTIVKGSAPYYNFLQGLDPSDAPEITVRLKSLARDLLVDNKPIVEYLGRRSEYEKCMGVVTELYSNTQMHESADLSLPIGYYSAAIVTRLADANHFMITSHYDYRDYSGKLAVLGKVLEAKYITPTMRGKYGAYGAGVYFYETSRTSAATGLSDIDLAISVWQGMGEYLRNMKLTQKELNAFIVSAVEEYDGEWGGYFDSEYGASFALTERFAGDPDRIRSEMLSTTVEDIRGYADFVDSLVGQMRVFAVLGKSDADSAKFNFAYYADADTLTVTPRFFEKSVRLYHRKNRQRICARRVFDPCGSRRHFVPPHRGSAAAEAREQIFRRIGK